MGTGGTGGTIVKADSGAGGGGGRRLGRRRQWWPDRRSLSRVGRHVPHQLHGAMSVRPRGVVDRPVPLLRGDRSVQRLAMLPAPAGCWPRPARSWRPGRPPRRARPQRRSGKLVCDGVHRRADKGLRHRRGLLAGEARRLLRQPGGSDQERNAGGVSHRPSKRTAAAFRVRPARLSSRRPGRGRRRPRSRSDHRGRMPERPLPQRRAERAGDVHVQWRVRHRPPLRRLRHQRGPDVHHQAPVPPQPLRHGQLACSCAGSLCAAPSPLCSVRGDQVICDDGPAVKVFLLPQSERARRGASPTRSRHFRRGKRLPETSRGAPPDIRFPAEAVALPTVSAEAAHTALGGLARGSGGIGGTLPHSALALVGKPVPVAGHGPPSGPGHVPRLWQTGPAQHRLP
jgi:hypothetical protein